MSCLKEENLQAYLDGELAAGDSDAMRTHLAACKHCTATAQEMEKVFAAIGGALAAELPGTAPTARLRARIEATLAEKATPKISPAQPLWRFGLVAASVLIVAGLIGWFAFGTRSAKPRQQARTETPTPSATPEPQPSPVLAREEASQPATPRSQRRVRHRAIDNNSEESEVVTQFFPLREGEDLTALDSMRLVRVELPGSALSEVGLPVAFEAANTSVKADVVLGDDGLARAIRFVR